MESIVLTGTKVVTAVSVRVAKKCVPTKTLKGATDVSMSSEFDLQEYTDKCSTAELSRGEARVRGWHAFRQVMDFFASEVFGRQVVLAGGCIRDMYISGHALISDYDLWVLGVKDDEIPLLDSKLGLACSAIDTRPEDAAVDENYTCNSKAKYHVPKSVWHFPYIPENKPVQIMYTQQPTMEDLLAHFDWRVCSFGFDGETVITDGVEDFHQHKLSFNLDNVIVSPKATLRRGFRIATKFARTPHFLTLPNELILALAAMLTLNGEGKEDKAKP